METQHPKRFPGESAEYRRARDQLLRAERDLRAQVENVAALRRRLPLGSKVPEDYVFEEGGRDLADRDTVRSVRLSQLFHDKKDTLVLYSFMFGPRMKAACPMCTSLLDGLNGTAPHAVQQIDFAVVARSPIQRIRDFARERGWRNLRLLSSAKNTYNPDYHGETADAVQMPIANVFVRRNGETRHFYATELLFLPSEPGQDSRHVDLLWPLWNLLDLTPAGRREWYPKLAYETGPGGTRSLTER